MNYSKILIVLLVFSFQKQFAQYTDQINSNRPGKSMMAFAVGKSVFQIESGVNYISENHKTLDYKANGFIGEFDIRWGLFFEELEFIAEFQYQNDNQVFNTSGLSVNRSALKKTIFGAKFLVYDPFKNYEEKVNLYSWKANHRFKWRQFIPAVAVYAGANLNFSDNPFNYTPEGFQEGNVSPKAMVIAQNHFGSRWVLVTNLAYNKIGTDLASIDYVLTLTRGFNARWSGFIENQGFNGTYYSDGILRAGAAFLFDKSMQVDASIGTNIKNTPGLINGGIGFSWRFDANYQDVKIEKDNGSKMDKKMKKKAEKEEKSKRKDIIE